MATGAPAAPAFDCVIAGGTVIDGTRAPRFGADVGIVDGRIAAVGDLADRAAARRIDARGRIVAPGFIDAHTHDDQAVRALPALPFKVSQGVTTVVTGNCGISIAPWRTGAPCPPPLDLMDRGDEVFTGFADYLGALQRDPAAVNVAALVGHSTLRVLAMDRTDRPATRDEIAAMAGEVEAALAAGAIGLSTGTFYPPAVAATTDEIIGVGAPLRGGAGLYATHMRDEADAVMAAIEETLDIGRALDCPVVISHHKLSGAANHGRSPQSLGRIAAAMRGQCVALDCYPYTAGSTMIRPDRGMLDVRVIIASSVPHPECAGRDLADIAAEWGVARDEAARRLQPGSAIYFMMDEGDVQRILAFDETMIGSDGIPLGDKPHPRLWGTFPRVLGHYSRGLGLFPLETAVWKMTGLTARNFGLADRGTVAVGQAADLVVFDADAISDTATYDDPQRPAAGIDVVLVNGEPVWQGGAITGARPGQVLRRTPRNGAPRPH
ncbi:N-acyl-D-amino-acid deacylase family protein [Rubrivivax albus]|uniref:D-aminoacylase n=1 Tax=Rubrivivax albus TaxID=2499835 RepID=A0A437K2I3_9BURK|nr:D-aminoacylase [Rubrivivax albus]RVT54520.1 D-aminoacylase [Rubrivivax albus]